MRQIIFPDLNTMTLEMSATHLSILKKLRADTGADDLTADLDKTFAAMDKRYSVSSTRVALTALRKAYPDNERIREEISNRFKIYRSLDKSQEPTKTQAEAHIAWDNIIAWRDSADLSDLDKLIVGLYTYVPPQRADYCPMVVTTRLPKTLKDGVNYVVVLKKSARFVFHAYKTAKVYGDRIVEVPPPLFALLKAHLGDRRDGYLFQTGAIPWTPARLTSNLRRIFLTAFGKLVSVNALRHSYITQECAGMPALAALEASAAAMDHSVIWHQTYRHISLEGTK